MYLLFSPLPRNVGALKGKIAANKSLTKQVTNTPLRGQGVRKYHYELLP